MCISSRLFSLSIFSSLLLSACGQTRQSVSRPAIVQGQPVEAQEFPVVSLLKKDSGGVEFSYCTGVLVSPKHVLTAAHCSLDAKGQVYEAKSVHVVWGENLPESKLDVALRVRALHPHPSYDSNQMGKDAEGVIKPGKAHDIAVWELEDAAKASAKIAAVIDLNSAEEFLKASGQVQLLGFGAKDGFASPWEAHPLLAAQTSYGPVMSVDVRRQEMIGGRLVTHTVHLDLPAYSETEFFAGGKDQPDTCKGDSGGPVMVSRSNGEHLLLGLTSRGSSQCDRGGVYTLVPAYGDWLKAQGVPLQTQTY